MVRGASGAHGGVLALVFVALVLAACTPAPQAGAAKPASGQPVASGGGSGNADNGKQLFQSKGCIACHVAPGVPGATGTIGPNLTGIGDTGKRAQLAGGTANTPQNLERWVRNPQAVKPGTMMPNLNLSDQEAADLVAFLQTLK